MPPIRISFFEKLTATTVSLRQPCRSGSARKLGRSMIVYSGSKPGSSVASGPDQQRADEEIVPRELVDDPDAHPMLGLRPAVEVGDIELVLVGERQQEIVMETIERLRRPSACCRCSTRSHCPVTASLTVNLSCALRPVCLPVRTTSGPSLASKPSPRRTACSTSGAVGEIPENLGAGRDALIVQAATRNPIGHL